MGGWEIFTRFGFTFIVLGLWSASVCLCWFTKWDGCDMKDDKLFVKILRGCVTAVASGFFMTLFVACWRAN